MSRGHCGAPSVVEAVGHRVGLVGARAVPVERLVGDGAVESYRAAAEGVIRVLTPRQRAVAALIAAGLTNEQVDGHLVITPGTVANHVEQILRRLDFAGRAQIAVWAAECGLYRSTSDTCRRGGAPRRPR